MGHMAPKSDSTARRIFILGILDIKHCWFQECCQLSRVVSTISPVYRRVPLVRISSVAVQQSVRKVSRSRFGLQPRPRSFLEAASAGPAQGAGVESTALDYTQGLQRIWPGIDFRSGKLLQR